MVITKGRKHLGYIATVNNKKYYAHNIYFYKDNEVCLHCEYHNLVCYTDEKMEHSYSIDEFELPIKEIKLRRKVKFDGEVFIISKGNSYGYLHCDIYIPSDMLDIQFEKRFLTEDKEEIKAIYKSSSNFYIEIYEKFIKRYVYDKLKDIEDQFGEISCCVNRYDLRKSPKDILEKLDKLNSIAKSYIEEKERIDNLTIDDIDMADLKEFYGKE